MASSQNRTLTALVIFQNFLYPVMYRSVHVYRSAEGKEEMEEREYLLRETNNFEEVRFDRVITLYKFDVSAQFVGNLNGVWKCMFVYDSNRDQSTSVDASPEWLSIAENPKIEFIPALANALRAISELALNVEEESGGNDIKSHQPEKQSLVPVLDLNSLPCSDSEIEENDQNVSENKNRKVAKTDDIARLSLEELAKYFDLPIVEVSRSLKVGVTVLKKKYREFGIP
ncbi:protein RKD5-like [Lycium barbarum]|uniref:protein RKD5-like n=1 Tax=Lycium barbarum TaxID=112863 RepID=UPI00293F5824|nr:protein RKD5-like [Lycium barbarum]